MHIQPIPPVGYGDFLAIMDNGSQHTDDMSVGNAVFFGIAVISADHIIIRTYFQNAVKHILTAVTLEKYPILGCI